MSSHSEPIGVYWDIENCRVPRGTSAVAVVNKIRERFYPGRREVEFMCVCDTTKEKKEILEELNKAQVSFYCCCDCCCCYFVTVVVIVVAIILVTFLP